MKRRRYLRPRRLVVDEDLYRRRAQGETLRELASDYGVSHTTLSRYLARPDAKAALRAARVATRRAAAQRRTRWTDEPVEAAGAAGPVTTVEAGKGSVVSRVETAWGEALPADPLLPRWADPYLNWLDGHDNRRPLTQSELRSENDILAAGAVAAGGGIAALVDATGLRTEQNVRRLIEPKIVARADANDAASSTIEATSNNGPAARTRPGPWHQEVSPDAGEP